MSPGMWLHVAPVTTDISVNITFIRRPLLGTANVVPSLLILYTLMMEAIQSFETSVLTGVTRRHISEGGILHSHRRKNLKSYSNNIIFTIVNIVI
jgi:hypothetical protein